MNVKKETTGHQRQQDIINVARRVTMLMNTGQLEQGDVAEMTAFLLSERHDREKLLINSRGYHYSTPSWLHARGSVPCVETTNERGGLCSYREVQKNKVPKNKVTNMVKLKALSITTSSSNTCFKNE